ncbi:hypothetical protein ACFYO1_15950 [Nocardia sp. NPDC006044]|uniref:hypothetical protein n=1 Tax=Nocardia sp. NPDC006044 TaxID=3364306 RepID=UPI0036D1995D
MLQFNDQRAGVAQSFAGQSSAIPEPGYIIGANDAASRQDGDLVDREALAAA